MGVLVGVKDWEYDIEKLGNAGVTSIRRIFSFSYVL
jgi:hypothetical protein